MKGKAYIAGPVRGLEEMEVRRRFWLKDQELRKQGYEEVYNPVVEVMLENHCREIDGPTDLRPILNDDNTRNMTIGYCLNLLCQCDEVHLLPGWEESQGANLERDVALRLGIKVVYPKCDEL